jgi:acetone carboxylase gamma subunit
MNRSVSPTLEILRRESAEHICCRECGSAIAEAGISWKPFARLLELPLHEAAGGAYRGAPDVRLRLFSCAGCGALLDSEIALPGEPFLEDVLDA